MDIPELARIITLDMNNGAPLTTEQQKNRIYDYIFLCFFLGNDFLPRFPALNIRTHGIPVLLETYKKCIGKPNKTSFIMNDEINWECVYQFISELANQEHKLIMIEHKLRNKFDHYKWPEETAQDREKILTNSPIVDRADEKSLRPMDAGYRERYYSTVLHFNTKSPAYSKYVHDICKNYTDGLNWVFQYYTKGCIDWRWKYNYNYPPLLKDLREYFRGSTQMPLSVHTENMIPLTYSEQLNYILPFAYKQLLLHPSDIIKTEIDGLPITFAGFYNRYAWECSVYFSSENTCI